MNPRKLYLRALNSQRNLRFDQVVALANAFGFRLDRIDGSHHIFRHPSVRGRVNLQPDNGMAKPYQVRQLLDLIAASGLTLEDEA
ncbi:MAG: hypothetical protein QOF73_201 [Thermomicrobiales bacterium]|nr:hypothetical protein [Thermomicrobiales bacterium]